MYAWATRDPAASGCIAAQLGSSRSAARAFAQARASVRWRSSAGHSVLTGNARARRFLTRSEYDRGVNTFSPEGRLFQVEYAIEAIKIGTTSIGIATKEGVVIAVEKRLISPLQEPGSVEKIYEVDSHIGVAMSGLSADARTLVDHARSESQYHRFTFNEPMPVESLTQAVCDLALNFGEGDEEQTMARPFGVALLVAGWDHHGPVLYHTDPSGTFTRFDAKAIGAGSEGAQTALQASPLPAFAARSPAPGRRRCPRAHRMPRHVSCRSNSTRTSRW